MQNDAHQTANVYQPLPGERYIRTLILEPARNREDPLVAGLELLSLGEKIVTPCISHFGNGPSAADEYIAYRTAYAVQLSNRRLPYTALSYSWAMEDGDASMDHELLLNGSNYQITRNLSEALRKLRLQEGQARLWVDAVCINQSDLVERGSQVAMMYDIYQMAARVDIWLGSGDHEANVKVHEVFQQMETVELPSRPGWTWTQTEQELALGALFDTRQDSECHLSGCLCSSYEPASQAERQQNSGNERMRRTIAAMLAHDCLARGLDAYVVLPKVHALVEWLARRYWSRRWIIQENKPQSDDPSERHIHFGMFKVDIITLEKSSRVLLYFAELLFQAAAKESSFAEVAVPFAHVIRRGARAVRSFLMSSGFRADLIELLQTYEHMQCGDPRDILYCLINLDPGCSMKPDYSLDMRETCIKFAKYQVDDGAAFVLIIAATRCVVEGPSLNLPSWIPDLRSPFLANARYMKPSIKAAMNSDLSLTLEMKLFAVLSRVNTHSNPDFTMAVHKLGDVPLVKPVREKTHRSEKSDLASVSVAPLEAGDTIFQTEPPGHCALVLRPVNQTANTYRLIRSVDEHDIFASIRLVMDGTDLGKSAEEHYRNVLSKAKCQVVSIV